jgi:hypothetical protein
MQPPRLRARRDRVARDAERRELAGGDNAVLALRELSDDFVPRAGTKSSFASHRASVAAEALRVARRL